MQVSLRSRKDSLSCDHCSGSFASTMSTPVRRIDEYHRPIRARCLAAGHLWL